MKRASLSLLMVHSILLVAQGSVFPKYNGVQDKFERLYSEAPELRTASSPSSSSNGIPLQYGDTIHDDTADSDLNDYFPTVYTPTLDPYVGDSDASSPVFVQFHAKLRSPADKAGTGFDNFESFGGTVIPEVQDTQPVAEADSRRGRPYEGDKDANGKDVSSGPAALHSKKIEFDKLPNHHEKPNYRKLIKRYSTPDNCKDNHSQDRLVIQRSS
ncbi:hypothetical protein K493DRAFT_316489 [Basidiobolus meristosporus CBS 931.73]|uniref:Uncharacterized protein n=1 Tax=Basidiobolus meristosporus CBS 931.73 TaxID=1314790 RepID=A0A1Y1Y3P8_9FUNG|nr:hypothetical protein K493DRAFT_316489 [Basidiobolus meristosporus CBS 931.73]|eukprot:ORX92599.1 hypothetical protein K493DRAFT_316489 [Basidiobolus meristosporus CBS 931.73]